MSKLSPARLRSALAGPLVLFAITVGIFWKLVLTHQYTWLDNPDYVYQVLPWMQFQAVQWHRGVFPLWDPYHWGGQSLIGQGQPGAAYPLNWILFLLPLKNGFIRQGYVHWYFVLIHYMGALFCYWLCRDLKRSRAASILAGTAFGLSGYCGNVDWPQMLNGAIWAPVVFLFFLRAMRGEAPWISAALSGAALGVSFLSGHHQAPIFISLAVGGAWLYFWMRGGPARGRIALLASTFALFVALTSGLQVLTIYEYGKLSLRWVSAPDPVGWDDKVPYMVHNMFSLGPVSLLGVIIPRTFTHVNPFVGLTIVSLALLAVAGSWGEPVVRFFAALAAGGLLFALGGAMVFHGMIYAIVPLVEKARVPAMAILLFHLGAAVLAAYGLDSYRSQAGDWIWARRLVWTLACLAGVFFTSIFVLAVFRPAIGFSQDEAAVTGLAALLLLALLESWRRGCLSLRAAGVLLILLLIFETGNSTGFYYRHVAAPGFFLRRMKESGDVAAFLLRQPGPVRAEIDRDLVPFNWGDWYGLEQFEGYCGVTRNVIENHADPLFRRLFAINYYVGAKPQNAGQAKLFQGAFGLNVYRNPDTLPRVWTVHEARQVSSALDGLRMLHSPGFDPLRRTYVAATPPRLDTCGRPDRVRIVSLEPNRMAIDADLGCRAMIVASDAYYPGWQATVDGRPAQIYEAYAVLRGIVAEAGTHRVELRYRPLTALAGAAMTLAGLGGALALSVLKIFRRASAGGGR